MGPTHRNVPAPCSLPSPPNKKSAMAPRHVVAAQHLEADRSSPPESGMLPCPKTPCTAAKTMCMM